MHEFSPLHHGIPPTSPYDPTILIVRLKTMSRAESVVPCRIAGLQKLHVGEQISDFNRTVVVPFSRLPAGATGNGMTDGGIAEQERSQDARCLTAANPT